MFNKKAQAGKWTLIFVAIGFILIYFSGLGAGLSEMSCSSAQNASIVDSLWSFFICNFFKIIVTLFLVIFIIATVIS
jgi:hypothetical protein